MKKVAIYYTSILDKTGKSICIGGIQNYLISLSEILNNQGYDVTIFQIGVTNFEVNYNGVKIIGVKCNIKHSIKKQIREVYEYTKNTINERDLIIWGTDKIALKTKHKKTIAIQHGVSFDYIPYKDIKFSSVWQISFFGFIYKLLQTSKAAREFLVCQTVVCVDYNYLNWIRTYLPRKFSKDAHVIPNFSKTTDKLNIIHDDLSTIKILFARRFEAMRGVDIMIDTVKEILRIHDNVEFTICGEGTLEKFIIEELGNLDKVNITKFSVGNSEKYNLCHHISIIPTYGSEGTSLSLLEAMAAGAVPVASNVGGMTNIVINEFNGFLINPKKGNFVETLSFLINRPSLLKKVSINAKNTVEQGFNLDLWSKKWVDVVNAKFEK